MCSSLDFIFTPGMRHSAAPRSISDHSAFRNSPGRTNTNGASCRALRTIKDPVKPSMARSRAPTSFGSVIVGYLPLIGGGRASLRSPAGSRLARPVATAYRKTRPQVCLARWAVSIAPLLSMRCSTRSNSWESISPTGRVPIDGNTSRSSRRIILSA